MVTTLLNVYYNTNESIVVIEDGDVIFSHYGEVNENSLLKVFDIIKKYKGIIYMTLNSLDVYINKTGKNILVRINTITDEDGMISDDYFIKDKFIDELVIGLFMLSDGLKPPKSLIELEEESIDYNVQLPDGLELPYTSIIFSTFDTNGELVRLYASNQADFGLLPINVNENIRDKCENIKETFNNIEVFNTPKEFIEKYRGGEI